MEKEFAPYEPSLALKELGFDEPCFGYYTGDKMHLVIRPLMLRANELESYVVTAPTFSQAFRFFREKYDLHRHICYFEDTTVWHGDIYNIKTGGLMNYPMELTNYNTYEEAELACLIKLIELVKENEKGK